MAGEAAAPGVQEERSVGFLGLMQNRNYALLWSGQLVSEMGNRLHWVAVSLWVYSLTKSAAAVSFAIASMFIGSLLVGLWAGVFVDRLNRKSILVLSDLVRAGLVVLIPSLIQSHLWLVYLDLALISVATAFFRPAIFAVIPQVVQRRHLLPANSFFTAMDTGTEIAGPLAAGLLAQSYGYAPLLYLDAFSYTVSAACVLAMAIPSLRGIARFDFRAVWSGAVEGLKYIRGDGLQYALFMLIFPATLVGAGLNALQTPLAKGIVGITDAEFGTWQSVWGLGFVVSSLMLGWYGAIFKKSRIIISGYLVGFLATALMGLSRNYQHLLVTAFTVGFANTLYYVGLGTVLMEYTPAELVGRVVSTRQVALAAARVISPVVFGAVAEALGIRQAIVLMAGIGALATVVTVWGYPSVRRFDREWQGPHIRFPRLDGILVKPVDTEFEDLPQQRLNIAALLMVAVGWVALTIKSPHSGILLLVLTLAVAFLGSELRRRGWLP